jgi:hypothetical protein
MRATRAVLVIFVASLLASAGVVAAQPNTAPPAAGSPGPAPAGMIDPDGVKFFEKNIRPVLVEQCYSCHSAGAAKVRGNFLLDTREGVAKGGEGGPVLVAGQPDKSRLITAIRWTDPDFQMPPKKKLSAEQIEKFEQWVKMGAPDPREAPPAKAVAETKPLSAEEAGRSLWALKPVERPDVPVGLTKSTNPIDAFVAAGYRSRGLTPVGRADRSTLLRRVYLDLIGIPPTPAEQNAFLNDAAPDAYERVVDRLLASEQQGVRYGRHWLDVLRYADADERMIAAPGIYLWRDWVIAALNEDVPYDQFVRAQLTGYRSTERTQISATGYRSKAEPTCSRSGCSRGGPSSATARGTANWRSARSRRHPPPSWASRWAAPSATTTCTTRSRSETSTR